MAYLFRIVIIFPSKAIGNDLTGQPFRDLFVMVDIPIDDQTSILRKQLCKLSEGMPDICKILKKVHVILFDIQNNTDFREKA